MTTLWERRVKRQRHGEISIMEVETKFPNDRSNKNQTTHCKNTYRKGMGVVEKLLLDGCISQGSVHQEFQAWADAIDVLPQQRTGEENRMPILSSFLLRLNRPEKLPTQGPFWPNSESINVEKVIYSGKYGW